MRVTVNGFVVEGTPEELAKLIRADGVISSPNLPPPPGIDGSEIEDDRFASEKIAYRALKRRPLSVAQRGLFRALRGAYPEWVSATRLQALTGYNGNQLGGLLGAIGRRLSETEGFVRNSAMLEWSWNADNNEYDYRLPPSVYHAVCRIDP